MLFALIRVLLHGVVIGAVCFAAGFFGPMILAPDANQGPLLGILITGPLGTLLGLGVGTWREVARIARAKRRAPPTRTL